jgi:hypothetical protein
MPHSENSSSGMPKHAPFFFIIKTNGWWQIIQGKMFKVEVQLLS